MSSANDDDVQHEASQMLKSAYEIQREQRIKENEAMLRALGLANGGGKLNPAESNVEGDVKVKKKKRKATTASDGVRKSRRTRGENPEGAGSTTRNTSKASSSAGGDADDDVERASDENRMLKYEALLERH
eukprot:gene3323-17011_t